MGWYIYGEGDTGNFSKGVSNKSQNHKIIKVGRDLQDHLVLSSPLPSPYDQCHPLNHVPKHQVQPFLEHPQGQWLHHLPGQPVPMPDCSFWEEMSPNFQPEAPLVQLEAIPSCPITSYLWEEAEPQLPTPSFQVVVESNKLSKMDGRKKVAILALCTLY